MNKQIIAAVISIFAAGSPLFAQYNLPNGILNSDRDVYEKGATPLLDWDVTFPGSDYIVNLKMIAADIKVKGEFRAINVQYQVGNNGEWKDAFEGTQTDINTGAELIEGIELPGGTPINLRVKKQTQSESKYRTEGSVSNDEGADYVKVLRDGDPVPSTGSISNQLTVGAYLDLYTTGSEGDETISLGPNEVLYVVEAGNHEPGDKAYDLQDAIILITFTPGEIGK